MNLSLHPTPPPQLSLTPFFFKTTVSERKLIKQYHPKLVWFHQTWHTHWYRWGSLKEGEEKERTIKEGKKGICCSPESDDLLAVVHQDAHPDFLVWHIKSMKLMKCCLGRSTLVRHWWFYSQGLFDQGVESHWITVDKSDEFGQSLQSDSADHDSSLTKEIQAQQLFFFLIWPCCLPLFDMCHTVFLFPHVNIMCLR